MKRTTSILALAALMFGLQPLSAQEDPHFRARTNYLTYCAACHGADMRGAAAGSLVDGNLQFGDSPRYFRRNIEDGISERGMPGFGQVLGEAEIDELVSFIEYRQSQEEGPVGPLPPPTHLSTIDYRVNVEVFADGLDIPWGIVFTDENTALITERPGPLRIVRNGELLPDPIRGIPEATHIGQGGMMDVAIDPDFARNGWVYLGYTHGFESGGETVAMTRIVRGRIRDHRWIDEQVLYEAPRDTYLTGRLHFGTRIVFDHNGFLFFSIGERGRGEHAQDLSRPNGKIHRIHRDGSIPADNPFVNRPGALPTIYTYGNRNPQGLAIHPETGDLWSVEHGPRGGDELNLMKKGRNYGWPVITYGINYNGTVITAETARPDMEQPIFYWTPSIAVCGLDFYTGDLFDRWKNRLLVSALRFEEVQVLNVYEHRVMHSEVIIKGHGRVRTAVTGPDGAIYVVQNDPDRVLRLTPESSIFWE